MKRLALVYCVVFALALAACGGGLAPTPTQTPPPPTAAPTATATPVPRSATVQSAEGTVEIKRAGQTEFAPVSTGDTVAVGDELRTGADGRAVITLDDGVGMVISADTLFTLSALEGTHETPINRWLLALGSIFTIGQGELAPGATFEIETPNGVATIRGSMLWVKFAPDVGMQTGCLIGHCSAQVGDEIVELGAGKQVSSGPEGFSEVTDLDARLIAEWNQAIKQAREAGVDVEGGLDPTCACDGPDMKCSDGSVVPAFPTCIEGAACECADGDLVCGDQTQADSPVCADEATDCSCAGPDLICAGGQTYYNVPACTAGQTCLCQGPDLACPDGSVYPNAIICAERSACQCVNGVEVCADGSTYFNTPTCASDLPCVCDGTTFVCTVEGETFTVPDYPLCGGGFGGAGGERTCVCSAGALYCSDGTIIPGDPSCAGGEIPQFPSDPGSP